MWHHAFEGMTHMTLCDVGAVLRPNSVLKLAWENINSGLHDADNAGATFCKILQSPSYVMRLAN
jgi:hypothetical protein